jgi:hypothetical protein
VSTIEPEVKRDVDTERQRSVGIVMNFSSLATVAGDKAILGKCEHRDSRRGQDQLSHATSFARNQTSRDLLSNGDSNMLGRIRFGSGWKRHEFVHVGVAQPRVRSEPID